MKIYRWICVLAMAAAIGTACERVNDQSRVMLEFVVSSVEARGESVYDNIANNDEVTMWCYNTESLGSMSGATGIFEELTFTSKTTTDLESGSVSTECSLVADEIYFWPESGYVKAFSCYPACGEIIVSEGMTEEGYPTIRIIQPEDAAEQMDILTATSSYISAEVGGTIGLTYEHQCAAIKFVSEAEETISKITIKGLTNYNGTFTEEGFEWGESLGESYDSYTTDLTEWMFIAPQTVGTIEITINSEETPREMVLNLDLEKGEMVTFTIAL